MQGQTAGRKVAIDAKPGRNLPLMFVAAHNANDRGSWKSAAKEFFESRLASKDDMAGLLNYVRIAGGEHDLVADALLAMDENCFTGQRRAVP